MKRAAPLSLGLIEIKSTGNASTFYYYARCSTLTLLIKNEIINPTITTMIAKIKGILNTVCKGQNLV